MQNAAGPEPDAADAEREHGVDDQHGRCKVVNQHAVSKWSIDGPSHVFTT
jgi:hypothetical protein